MNQKYAKQSRNRVLGSHGGESVKMAVFWIVALCSLMKVYRRFVNTCRRHRNGFMTETARTFETSVSFYHTTLCNKQEDSHLHNKISAILQNR
jgi:hypothetical protein